MKRIINTLVLLVGICFLIALGIWFLSRKTEANPARVTPQKQSAVATKPATVVFDADGDGLPDWEEALWSTNPKKPDTDGDGTPDGEEVAVHRNPRKAGPSDSLETPLAVSPLENLDSRRLGVPESARAGVVSYSREEKQPPPYQNTAPPLVRGITTTYD